MRIAWIIALAIGCQSSDVSRSIGARCERNADCDELCLTTGWPGGFCTISCDTNDECGEGAACVEEGGTGICAFTCSGDPSCTFLNGGYTCMPIDGHTGGLKVMVCHG